MSKKVLIINTSFRKGGNSDLLSKEFEKGAMESGNTVENVYLGDKEIKFCRGCLACQTTKKCIIKDDVKEILDKMVVSDVIVFSTPIYYYEMSGQMKTLIDRTNPLFVSEYNFRDIYLIASCADESENSMDGAVKGLEGWIECFDQTRIAGVIRGTGATDKGDILENDAKMKQAYEMGKSIK